MKVIMDLCIVPIGVGVSVSRYIAACQPIFSELGLKTHLHAYGTNIEGEWDIALAALKRCHQLIHEMGAPRITTTIKLGTRTDREQTMDDKVKSVEQQRPPAPVHQEPPPPGEPEPQPQPQPPSIEPV